MALSGAVLWHAPAQAATHRAALVIQHSSSWPGPRVIWRCVEFAQDAISGLALLELAGVNSGQPPQIYDWGGGADTVCQVDREPLQIPARCFGPMSGPNWSDWHATNAGWVPRAAGVTGYSVSDGDLEGWTYTAGFGSPPPSARYAQVCPSPTAKPPATAASVTSARAAASPAPVTASATARAAPTVAAVTPSLEALLPTVSPTIQAAIAASSTSGQPPRSPGSTAPLMLFGSTVAVLLGLLLWNLRRHAP